MASSNQAHSPAEESTPLLVVTTSSTTPPEGENRMYDVEESITPRPLATSPSSTIPNRFYGILAVSVLVSLVSGTLYGYGRYARDLKEALDLSQFELERLGILLDTGNFFGHPLTGFVYDHFGPQVSCMGSAFVLFVAYGMIHLGVVDASRFTFPAGVLDLCFFLVGFGTGLGYIAALGSTTKNFSKTSYKSLAIAIVATGYGLCSTLVGISYQYLGLTRFFLFWAVLVAVMNMVGASVFGGVEDGLDAHGHAPAKLSDGTETLSSDATEEEESENDDQQEEHRGHSRAESVVLSTRVRFEALKSTDFWLLFAAFTSCTGCGLFIINNVSLMVQSIGGHDSLAGHFVILLSFSNCAGRLIMGSLADRQCKLTLLACGAIVMSSGLFLSGLSSDIETARIRLTITVITVAMAYGGLWVLIVAILSEWFGTHDFGTNYGVIVMGPALSGMIFNFLSAYLYERQATNSLCLGTDCFRYAFLLTGGAAGMTSFLLWCLAHSRWRRQIKQ